MQACGCFLRLGVRDLLQDLDVLSFFTAALVHDLGHPGYNNSYAVNAVTPLAIRYNDISVLENFHCSMAFTIFGQADSSIFVALDTASKIGLRKNLIGMILATDISAHFPLHEELRLAAAVTDKDALTPANRLTLLKSFLHAADISNPNRRWALSKKWSDLVLQEFLFQGDLEASAGLPIRYV
jgi:cAMP-specific phosphodiesterase 4